MNLTIKILQELIKTYKKDMGFPEDFEIHIREGWPKPLDYCCICIPEYENGRIKGVTIKINSTHGLKRGILHLLHEISHAKDFYEGRSGKFREIKADLYSFLHFPSFYLKARKLKRDLDRKL